KCAARLPLRRIPPQNAEHGVVKTYLENVHAIGFPHELQVTARRGPLWTGKGQASTDGVPRRRPAARERQRRSRQRRRRSHSRRLSMILPRVRTKPITERECVQGPCQSRQNPGPTTSTCSGTPQSLSRAKGIKAPILLFDDNDDDRDEIDKVGQSNYHGDPSVALLEVLDPERNVAFNVRVSSNTSPETSFF
ncbi:hypothetical protein EDB92DRAFT_1876593, partial [Lactarius akahatsu]